MASDKFAVIFGSRSPLVSCVWKMSQPIWDFSDCDILENGGEFGGGLLRLFLEAEEGGDFGGGFGEGEGEFAVIHLLVGGHEEIEIERQVL